MNKQLSLFLCLFPFALSLFAQMDSAAGGGSGRGGHGGRGGGFRAGGRFGGEGPGMMMKDSRAEAEAAK